MKARMHGFLLPAAGRAGGQRLCIHHLPAEGAVRANVFFTHPFAEEMNKSRRMAALAARALAAAGCSVLQLDLLGCGDSSGDFADATWADWLDDIEQGARWLQAQHAAPLWLWGLRAGCLLNLEAAPRLEGPVQHLFWQPPASGKALLQQFLRLKLAGALAEGRSAPAEDPRQQLDAGRPVEIAGYTLSPPLAQGLERAQLAAPAAPGHSVWLETSTREGSPLLPATQAAVARWREDGHAVQAQAVPGPAFWQTQEIEDAPALVQATVQLLLAPVAGTAAQAVPA